MTGAQILPDIGDAMVAMGDGVHLATDVYLPAGPGPFPVLFERTPYGKRGSNRADRTAGNPEITARPAIARRFADAGYAYVLQDCRGRYGSEGRFTKYLSEGEDGETALAWIMVQPWCNGRVGTLGLSYGAHVQAALACGNPPGMAAMFLDSGGFSSAYHSGIRQGGAYELKQLTWASKHALLSAATRADPDRQRRLMAEDVRDWMARRWQPGHSPVAAAPEYEAYVVEQWDRDNFSVWWRQRGLYARGWYPEFADVPQVHMASWYDPYALTAVENFVALSAMKRGPVRLVMGPWTHGQRSVTWSGDVDFGPAATLDGQLADDYFELRRAWFDCHLASAGTPDPLPSPVTLFVMGGGTGRRNQDGRLDHGGRWRRLDAWPPPDMHDTPRFLHADGTLGDIPPGHNGAAVTIVADPAAPVPTVGGAIASGEPVMQAGAFDQREQAGMIVPHVPGRRLGDRTDVAVFRTPPLHQDVELTGQVRLNLHVSCSTPDADIAVRLMDEYPPSIDYPEGYAMNLAHGILRLRFRASFEEPQAMTPGKIEEIAFATFPTSNLFKQGHRIRIEIAGSNFPHFDVNPNCDWRVPGAEPGVAEITLHCDAAHPSLVVLPLAGLDGADRECAG